MLIVAARTSWFVLHRLVAWLLATVLAAQAVPPAEVVLLHMNDFHGQFRPLEALWRPRAKPEAQAELVGGAASLAGYVRATRTAAAASGAKVVLTDAGDWFQGTLEGNSSQGSLAMAFLSRLRLDATVIGNHEYDFGHDNLRRLVALAEFPVLGANLVVDGATNRMPIPYARAFCVVEVHGLRLVLLGLCTSDAKNVSTGPFGDVGFEREEAALAAVLPAARAAGDVVVLLTHCGLEADRRLAAAFPEIPLILGGHSHTALRQPYVQGSTWIVQTQGKATSIYRIEAQVEKANKRLALQRAELVELDLDRHPEDPETAAWIREQTRELAATWDRVIGELVTPLLDERGAHSTAAGNLLCDTLLEATGADLAFTNKGGIRARLRPGPLTPRQLYELMPFENTCVSMTLRGAQVRALLQATMASGRRLLDIGGGSYTYAVVDGQRQLRTVTVAGQPLDDARTYRVTTSSFLANGGDGCEAFAQGTEVVDHRTLLRDLLIGKAERERRLVSDTRQRIAVEESR